MCTEPNTSGVNSIAFSMFSCTFSCRIWSSSSRCASMSKGSAAMRRSSSARLRCASVRRRWFFLKYSVSPARSPLCSSWYRLGWSTRSCAIMPASRSAASRKAATSLGAPVAGSSASACRASCTAPPCAAGACRGACRPPPPPPAAAAVRGMSSRRSPEPTPAPASVAASSASGVALCRSSCAPTGVPLCASSSTLRLPTVTSPSSTSSVKISSDAVVMVRGAMVKHRASAERGTGSCCRSCSFSRHPRRGAQTV
mmetsp:Transcript_20163/g.62481  ORF Transcript_20163/g.62481 Transcript_20163/m.62481 type:complete len:255 (+) Transcript_20163:1209-1973(+)